MFRWKNHQDVREEAAAYATRRDFQEIFTEDMVGLHLLAFLLTADVDKAGQCFVAGLQSSIEGNPVFRQWARAWSKRAIIKHAIKMVAPTPGQAGTPSQADDAALRIGNPQANTFMAAVTLIAAVTRLAAFERFVLVITVLEDYSTQECAELLSRSIEEVTTAKSQALKSLGSQAASTAVTKRSGAWAALLAATEPA